MNQFRKKPVVIEAVQWHKPGDHPEVTALPHDHPFDRHSIDPAAFGWVKTLEGGHVVSPGDWIIRGVAGEFYPCKPDIFAATYEPAALADKSQEPQQAGEAQALRGSAPIHVDHELKCWPGPFSELKAGLKTAEFRRNDRGFRVGDWLRLNEWSPEHGYTGRIAERQVTAMTEGFGIPEGFCMLSLASTAPPPASAPAPVPAAGERKRFEAYWSKEVAMTPGYALRPDFKFCAWSAWRECAYRAPPASTAAAPAGGAVHELSGLTAEELWIETGRLRAIIADLKVASAPPAPSGAPAASPTQPDLTTPSAAPRSETLEPAARPGTPSRRS